MNWKIKQKITEDLIKKYPEINPVILQLLYNRGLDSQEKINSFLNPNYDLGLHNPFLFKDMELAVKRIFSALSKKEKILIYGDYDADGVCSTAIIYSALQGLGGDLDIYIPFRESEGYGINSKAVQWIISQKFNLVITVDCGISNKEEIQTLKNAGIDTIITDHHEEPLALPDSAIAIINPSISNSGYPKINLCGAGVAFKLVQALIEWQNKIDFPIKLPIGFEKWLLDLVAIATIGDIMPLIGENRILTKYGLLVLKKTRNIGLQKLIELINSNLEEIDSEYVGWRIVPRLNAAGRINHASLSFYLLKEKNPYEAKRLVSILEENNKSRQQTTENILKQALSQIDESKELPYSLIILGENWPTGIIGLVAGRLADKFHRPVLIFSQEEDKYIASGRSIPEFDITEALQECDDLLTKYGGHPQACGLTITGQDNFEKFKLKFLELAKQKLASIKLEPMLEIEAELKLSEINWEIIDELEKFEPFGEANPKPLFAAFGLQVEHIQTVGIDGRHLKIQVTQDGAPKIHKLIGFSFGEWCAKINVGDKIDIVFELGINEWNGNRELQLKIEDIKLSSE